MEKGRIAFDRHGIPPWIDLTPDVSGDRAEEVQAWIALNEPCVSVVIDDDCDGFEKTGSAMRGNISRSRADLRIGNCSHFCVRPAVS